MRATTSTRNLLIVSCISAWTCSHKKRRVCRRRLRLRLRDSPRRRGLRRCSHAHCHLQKIGRRARSCAFTCTSSRRRLTSGWRPTSGDRDGGTSRTSIRSTRRRALRATASCCSPPLSLSHTHARTHAHEHTHTHSGIHVTTRAYARALVLALAFALVLGLA
eukprot:6186976-Pleurochrysis_carterae.AAC.3